VAAPELIISEGLYVGCAVDVWSCGVNLYAIFVSMTIPTTRTAITSIYFTNMPSALTFPDNVSMDLLSIVLAPDPK